MSPGAAAPRFRVTSSITGSIRSLRSSPNYKYWVYGAVAIGLWINVTDQSGVNIALPEIAEEFTADIPTVQWITLGYSLATSAMLMPMGRLSDMFGRKLVYLLGFVMFSAMALVGGLSQSLGFLIGVKIMQGLASAGIQANSMALITEVFPDRERGKAMGLYMAIIGTGAVAGPMAGGILISHFGWRSIFFAVLSVAILSMICAALVLNPNPPKDTDGRREDSGRGVRELQGRWPGLHWGRWEVGGRSSVAAQGPYGRLRELRCAGWRENTQQGTLADRGGASLRGRWVSCRLAVRPGVEWLAAGPRRERTGIPKASAGGDVE